MLLELGLDLGGRDGTGASLHAFIVPKHPYFWVRRRAPVGTGISCLRRAVFVRALPRKIELVMAVMSTVGFMAQANAEIRAAQRRHEVDTVRRWRLRRPMAVIDELVNDLEILNVRRVYRVPLSYETRLLQLRVILDDAGVSPSQLDGVRTRIRIVRLMDQLYAIQESLLGGERDATDALAGLDHGSAGDQPLQRAVNN